MTLLLNNQSTNHLREHEFSLLVKFFPRTFWKGQALKLANRLQWLNRKYWNNCGAFFWKTAVSPTLLMAQRMILHRNVQTPTTKSKSDSQNVETRMQRSGRNILTYLFHLPISFYVCRRVVCNKNLGINASKRVL